MFCRINRDKNNLLSKAYENGDFKKFKNLIKNGHNVNCISKNNCSLISNVLLNENDIDKRKNKLFFNLLLEQDVFLGRIGNEKPLLMICAFKKVGIEYMEILLNKISEINLISERVNCLGKNNCYSLMGSLIVEDSFEKIKLLLRYKPDLKIKGFYHDVVLNELLSRNANPYSKLPVLELLPVFLELGADPNQKCRIDDRSLHVLIDNCVSEDTDGKLFEILIKKGADVNSKNKHGITPMMTAAWHDIGWVIKTLVENNADMNITNNTGRTAAMIATFKESVNTLMDLNDLGADMKIRDHRGFNVAHHIADKCNGLNKYYKFFEKNKGLLLVKNNDGDTVMDIIKTKHPDNYSDINNILKNNNSIEL